MNVDRFLRRGLFAVALIVAGCSSPGSAASPATAGSAPAPTSSPAAASPVPSGTLASVEQRGGECPAATCDTTVYLDFDGRIHVSAKPPNDLGTATSAQVQALEAAIAATDFNELRRPAFSGQCPTAYDGQELVFTFTTATGTQRLAACESVLDYSGPLFRALTAALGSASPIRTAP